MIAAKRGHLGGVESPDSEYVGDCEIGCQFCKEGRGGRSRGAFKLGDAKKPRPTKYLVTPW